MPTQNFSAALSALAVAACELTDRELVDSVLATAAGNVAVHDFMARMNSDLPVTRRPSRDYKPEPLSIEFQPKPVA